VQLNGRLVRIIGMDTEKKYKKLFGYINLTEPPRGLRGQILSLVGNEQKRLAKIRTWAFGSGSIISFGFSLWAIIYLVSSVKESGFWQYFSLLFSGDSAVYLYWHELSLSLIESLPITGLIIFLTAIGFFIWSFANTLKDKKFIYA
jgi:hypothetical protein